MHNRHTKLLALLSACLFSLVLAASAVAAEPATVTVRVEGASQTLLAPTQVTTTTAPVIKDGNPADSCAGTNAVGALQAATAGNWSGKWESSFHEYTVETILGETHLFTEPTFWEFWIDNAPSDKGVCAKEIHTGDTLLFFPNCFGECPPPSSPLGIEAPNSAAVATKVPVTVTSYAEVTGAPSPAAAATVTYEGKTVETDASGHATLEFARAGREEVKVTKALSIRTETIVCVHAGEDGTCGTAAPKAPLATPAVTPAPYKGAFALVAEVTSYLDGHVYPRGSAPRLISGRISSHSSVTSVSLALRRSYRGRCFAYDGTRARFVRSRCGTARFFPVAKEGTFSYLLPSALAPGRYVLDVNAGDVAGNATSLARGTSRLVFRVR